MIVFFVFLVLIIILSVQSAFHCADESTWHPTCNDAQNIILSPGATSFLTCVCFSNETKSVSFLYPSLVPDGNPKVEQYHYDQQDLLKLVVQHYNFTKSGLAIACWGETCIIDKNMRKSLNDKNIAVLLHYFERTLDDPIPSNLIFLPYHLYVRAK